MSRYIQRLNEVSSISPSGFTGIIIENSNAIVEKSFLKKGTSFVNVFDNSNVLLKDCGSPIPYITSSTSAYEKTSYIIKNEVEKELLPFWFHYQFKRGDKVEGDNLIKFLNESKRKASS